MNNVETICRVPHIITRGAEWFAGLGTKTQGGTRMYSVSGRVDAAGRVRGVGVDHAATADLDGPAASAATAG